MSNFWIQRDYVEISLFFIQIQEDYAGIDYSLFKFREKWDSGFLIWVEIWFLAGIKITDKMESEYK